MSDAFFLRWMKEHVSCENVMRTFIDANVDVLDHLDKVMLRRLNFRCETKCNEGSGCHSQTLRGFFSASDNEIVLCDCGHGIDRTQVPQLRATLRKAFCLSTVLF